jgi:hypothetical protein
MGTLRHTCGLTARTCVKTPANSPQPWRYMLWALVYLVSSVCSLQFSVNWSRSWILICSSWRPCSSWFPTFCLSPASPLCFLKISLVIKLTKKCVWRIVYPSYQACTNSGHQVNMAPAVFLLSCVLLYLYPLPSLSSSSLRALHIETFALCLFSCSVSFILVFTPLLCLVSFSYPLIVHFILVDKPTNVPKPCF